MVDTANPTAEFSKYNKLAKVPVFVGADGYVLTECIAIAIYGTSQPRSSKYRSSYFCLFCGPLSCAVAAQRDDLAKFNTVIPV